MTGSGVREHPDRRGGGRAAAAREHDVHVASRSAPRRSSPRRCGRRARRGVMRLRQVEHDAQRVAGLHQLEAALDLVERQAMRDEPVERETPARGRARACAGSRARASTSRRSSRGRDAPCAGMVAAGSDSTASARGMPMSTAAPRARVERNAACIASGRPVASTASRRRPRTPLARPRRSLPAFPARGRRPLRRTCARRRASAARRRPRSTGSAPTATAAISADSPTPPQPTTAKRSPGLHARRFARPRRRRS